MGNPLLQVEWQACELERRSNPAFEAALKRRMGMGTPPWASYFGGCPWVVEANVELSYADRCLARLDGDIADLVALAVSQDNSCRYCYAVSRTLMRLQGWSERQVQELEQKLAASQLEPRAAAAVAFARRMSRSTPLINAADHEAMRAAGFDADEIRDVAYVVANMAYANRIVTIPAIQPQSFEGLTDRWFFALVKPLMGSVARAYTVRHAPPGRVLPSAAGPYADVIAAYAATSAGTALGRTVEQMWASPVLPRRAKALMLAVIARALGCERSMAEARGWLQREGLEPGDIDRAMTHLSSDALPAEELQLAAFARDTLWYQPVQVQQRAKDLRRRFSQDQMLEAVGVAALGNAICRLRSAAVPH